MIDMVQADRTLRHTPKLMGVYEVRDCYGELVATDLVWFEAYSLVMSAYDMGLIMTRTGEIYV